MAAARSGYASRVSFRFRGKSGHATDITGMTEFDPKRSFGSIRWTDEFALDFGRPEREVATDRAIKAW